MHTHALAHGPSPTALKWPILSLGKPSRFTICFELFTSGPHTAAVLHCALYCRIAFMELYDRFVREVVLPLCSKTGAAVSAQTPPTVRVHMPGSAPTIRHVVLPLSFVFFAARLAGLR